MIICISEQRKGFGDEMFSIEYKNNSCHFEYSCLLLNSKRLYYVSPVFRDEDEYTTVYRAIKKAQSYIRDFLKENKLSYSPEIIRKALKQYQELQQLQLIQEDKNENHKKEQYSF